MYSMTPSYLIPVGPVIAETQVKKSRFITHLAPAGNRTDALTFIQSLRNQHPNARHCCSAYVAGPPEGNTAIAFDDDGEPAGTAGRPILNVLMHKRIGEIVAVVIRYFGGIKLGAGGLVRAYSSAAQTAVDSLSLTERVFLINGVLTCEYAQENMVRHCLQTYNVKLLACEYGAQITMTVTAPQSQYNLFIEQVTNKSNGRIIPQLNEKHSLYPSHFNDTKPKTSR